MSMETDLRSYLLAQSSISTLIADRLYIHKVPQSEDTLPCITFNRVDGGYADTLIGSAGYASPQVVLQCSADTYLEAQAVAEALRQKLQGFSGMMGSTRVYSVILRNQQDDYDPPDDADDSGVYHILLTYTVMHEVSIPTF